MAEKLNASEISEQSSIHVSEARNAVSDDVNVLSREIDVTIAEASKQNDTLKNEENKKGPMKIENLDKALRIFKRKNADKLAECRKREAYDPPSVKRKKKSKEARKNKKRFGGSY